MLPLIKPVLPLAKIPSCRLVSVCPTKRRRVDEYRTQDGDGVRDGPRDIFIDWMSAIELEGMIFTAGQL